MFVKIVIRVVNKVFKVFKVIKIVIKVVLLRLKSFFKIKLSCLIRVIVKIVKLFL